MSTAVVQLIAYSETTPAAAELVQSTGPVVASLPVSSVALKTWKKDAKRALDEIAAAHAAVGGQTRGRRYATQEINHAYAVLLSSQFQRFCRDLHTEAVAHLVAAVLPPSLRPILRARLCDNRKLDHGNPNPGNLGSDFGRLGFDFWAAVHGRDTRNPGRKSQLENLAGWRNAIAHQDFDPAKIVPPLRLAEVQRWRSACSAMAHEFDQVVRDHLVTLVGVRPW